MLRIKRREGSMIPSELPRSGAPSGNGRKRNKYTARQSVFMVRVPDTWKPQRPWSVPPCFSEGRLLAGNLSMRQALGFARTHNKAALAAYQRGDRTMPWAIVSRHLRPRRWWPERTAKEGGGA